MIAVAARCTLLAVVLTGVACGSDVPGLADACSPTQKCAGGLRCVDGTCVPACEIDADCGRGDCCSDGACVDPGLGGTCSASAEHSQLVVLPTSQIEANGVASAQLRAELRDSYDRPLRSVPAHFVASGRRNNLAPSTDVTGARGELLATLASTAAETKTITVEVDGKVVLLSATTNFVPGSPARVGFVEAPASAATGAEIANVRVAVVDAFDNAVLSNDPVAITVSLDATPRGATLTGGRTVTVNGGPLDVTGLSVDVPGARYTLHAAASGWPAGTSSPFAVTAARLTTTSTTFVATVGESVAVDYSATPAGAVIAAAPSAALQAVGPPARVAPFPTAPARSPTSVRLEALPASGSRGRGIEVPASRPLPGTMKVFDVTVMADGDVVLGGSYDAAVDFGAGVTLPAPQDIEGFVLRLDGTSLTPLWVVPITGVGNDRVYNVAAAGDDVVAAGFFYFSELRVPGFPIVVGTAGSDTFVTRIGANGAAKWVNTIEGSYDERPRGLAVAGDRTFVAGDLTTSVTIDALTIDPLYSGAYIVALNANGAPIWGAGAGSQTSLAARGIAVSADGAEIALLGDVAGTARLEGPNLIATLGGSSTSGAFAFISDQDGDPYWATRASGAGSTATSIVPLAGGGFAVAGQLDGTILFDEGAPSQITVQAPAPGAFIAVVKDGYPVWGRVFAGSALPDLTATGVGFVVGLTAAGTFSAREATGQTWTLTDAALGAVLAEHTAAGDLVWMTPITGAVAGPLLASRKDGGVIASMSATSSAVLDPAGATETSVAATFVARYAPTGFRDLEFHTP